MRVSPPERTAYREGESHLQRGKLTGRVRVSPPEGTAYREGESLTPSDAETPILDVVAVDRTLSVMDRQAMRLCRKDFTFATSN